MTKEEILAMKPRELDKAILQAYFPEFKSYYYSTYWFPSVSISIAWQIVEKLIERYVFTLLYDDTGVCWVCKLFDGQEEIQGIGKVAPEAISRAALLAKLDEFLKTTNPIERMNIPDK